MRVESLELRIDRHAHDRYCERVEPIPFEELGKWLAHHLSEGYGHHKGYLQTGGVWWRVTISQEAITFHSCYGQHHIDLPAAIKWAKRHRDRISLGDTIAD
ncbi:hypothetical protein KZ483_24145 [Paenibacillus sp. sptzw28]|uniref:hypothetical protein n=1 Tax=Paenibacillus sp. sptzw28 TaxID=715179 RepID=UPI001C6E9AE0|nr:hypothetical protein [Paenibacillus sp. sptzw28]QYR20813.1 hypothetical protein KZ483_24145 [Paenibacillus sp. sptzw28]